MARSTDRQTFQVGDDDGTINYMFDILNINLYNEKVKRVCLSRIFYDAFMFNEKKIKSGLKKNDFVKKFHESVRNSSHDKRKRLARDVHAYNNLRYKIIEFCCQNADNSGILDYIKVTCLDNQSNKYDKINFKNASKINNLFLDELKSKITELVEIRNFEYKYIKNMQIKDIFDDYKNFKEFKSLKKVKYLDADYNDTK